MAQFTNNAAVEPNVAGMALPLLRETLMTAVIVELPEAVATSNDTEELGSALAFAITADRLGQQDAD
jgi:hypothetical protein